MGSGWGDGVGIVGATACRVKREELTPVGAQS